VVSSPTVIGKLIQYNKKIKIKVSSASYINTITILPLDTTLENRLQIKRVSTIASPTVSVWLTAPISVMAKAMEFATWKCTSTDGSNDGERRKNFWLHSRSTSAFIISWQFNWWFINQNLRMIYSIPAVVILFLLFSITAIVLNKYIVSIQFLKIKRWFSIDY